MNENHTMISDQRVNTSSKDIDLMSESENQNMRKYLNYNDTRVWGDDLPVEGSVNKVGDDAQEFTNNDNHEVTGNIPSQVRDMERNDRMNDIETDNSELNLAPLISNVSSRTRCGVAW